MVIYSPEQSMRGFLFFLVMPRGNEFRGGESSTGAQGCGARNRGSRVNAAAMHNLTMAVIYDLIIPVKDKELA
jgi:hypothetical protein